MRVIEPRLIRGPLRNPGISLTRSNTSGLTIAGCVPVAKYRANCP